MITVLHMIPTLEGGGAERQLFMLATEQARRGINVHVAIRRGGVHMQPMRDCGVQCHELGNLRSLNPRLFLAIRRLLKSTKPSIVQTWLPQMDILGGLAALQSGIPWIISERTSKEYYAEIPRFALLRLSLGRFASAVVANSEGGANYWRESARGPIILATIRNALELKRIREAPRVPMDGFSRPVLLVVGRFTPEKALEIIVRAIGGLAGRGSVNLVMIGEGAQRRAIEAEIEAASLSAVINILPYQPDWWGWLKTAEALISMSRYEGNPNVVLEAMAGGCPVILSDIPAHREIADASSAFFVPVDDVPRLSGAIAALVGDKQAALQNAKRASARTDSMTIKAMADAYDAVYKVVRKRKS
jgi:glycosyltransferase involved in cell wall biosynthesis